MMLKLNRTLGMAVLILISLFVSDAISLISNTPHAPSQAYAQGPCDDPSSAACFEHASSFSAPGERIGVNMGVVAGYEFFRVKETPANIYNGPYGGDRILYTFHRGYHFITPRQQVGAWYEINVGEWMHERHLESVDPSYFSGVIVNSVGDWGWILQNHFASASPGGEAVQIEAYRVYRYTRVGIGSVVYAGGANWYQIGPNKWVSQFRMSVPHTIAPPAGVGSRWVAVDLYEQSLVAYEGSTPVFATLISSGLPGWDTRPGVFQVWGRSANAPMSGAEGRDDAYRLENVPYAMYFDGEISLHGTYWHNGFGYRQSHGCVNLSVSDSAWLWNWLGSGSVYVYYSASY